MPEVDTDELVARVRARGPAGAQADPPFDPDALGVPGVRLIRLPLLGLGRPAEAPPPSVFPPPCGRDDVAAAEAALGVTLPPLLVRLYTEVADGGFGPGDGAEPIAELAGLWESYAVELVESEDVGEWPAGVVPFCELDQTLTACVDCTTPDGAVVAFEFDDMDPDDPDGLAAALTVVAPSLAEWLADWVDQP
jgi:hypothetical protein